MICAGIDCGALYTKAVIVKNQMVIARHLLPTGSDVQSACESTLRAAIESTTLQRDQLHRIAGAGAWKSAIPQADLLVDDLNAIARAAVFFFPDARNAVDVGAEEGRVVRLDENGNITDSAINERCAAGAGIFIDSVAKLMNRTVDEMGALALKSDREIPLNGQCVLFAEAEILELIRSNTRPEDICKAIHDAMGARIVTLISRVGIEGPLVMMGGTAKNPGLTTFVKAKLRPPGLHIPTDPEYGAAIGAALIATETETAFRETIR